MNRTNSSALKARNTLLILFGVLIILDSVLVVVSKDLWAIGRVLATIIVMYYVIQGKKWAKWVLIAILSLVMILLTALIIALHSKLSTFLVVGSLVLIILNLITISFIIFSQNLARYFAALRHLNVKH